MSIAEKLQLVTALILSGAVGAAWRSVFLTRRAATAQLTKSFLDQYASPKWAAHVRSLEKFSETQPDGTVRFAKELMSGTTVTKGSDVDDARRVVHWFYKNAWNMYKAKLLHKKAMKLIVATNAYETFHDVAVPLSKNSDYLLDKDERWRWYDEFLKKFPPKGSRKIISRAMDDAGMKFDDDGNWIEPKG